MKILFFVAGLKLKILFRTRRKIKIHFILTEKWKSSSSFILGGVRDSRVPVPGVAGVPGSGADTEGHDWRHHPPLHAQGMSGLFGASNIIARSFIFVNKNSLVYFRQKKKSFVFIRQPNYEFVHIHQVFIFHAYSRIINSCTFISLYQFMDIRQLLFIYVYPPYPSPNITFANNY